MIYIANLDEAIERSKQNQDLVLIIRTNLEEKVICSIRKKEHRIIFWSHNYLTEEEANVIKKTENIVANIFVGKQMYDKYIDHDVIKKSTYIYNIITDPVKEVVSHTHRRQEVVYMGSIIPQKGLLETLKIWKVVEKECPDAKLKILGGGKLYSDFNSMGTLGLAKESYEKLLFPYLSDERGEIKENIELLGILGEEKYEIFLNAKVGIVNPSAKTETFCLGVVEMASAELPVVSRKANGLCDTVIDKKTGRLFYSYPRMAKEVITLLRDTSCRETLGRNAKYSLYRFSPEIIIPQWIALFQALENNDKNFFRYKKISKPYLNNQKFLRLFMRRLGFDLGLRFLPSILKVEWWGGQVLKKMKT